MILYSKHLHNQNNTTINSFSLKWFGFFIFFLCLSVFIYAFYVCLMFLPIMLFLLVLPSTYKQKGVQEINILLFLHSVFVSQTPYNLEKNNNFVFFHLLTPGSNMA